MLPFYPGILKLVHYLGLKTLTVFAELFQCGKISFIQPEREGSLIQELFLILIELSYFNLGEAGGKQLFKIFTVPVGKRIVPAEDVGLSCLQQIPCLSVGDEITESRAL